MGATVTYLGFPTRFSPSFLNCILKKVHNHQPYTILQLLCLRNHSQRPRYKTSPHPEASLLLLPVSLPPQNHHCSGFHHLGLVLPAFELKKKKNHTSYALQCVAYFKNLSVRIIHAFNCSNLLFIFTAG